MPAVNPVNKCKIKPIYWATLGSWNPKEIPITPKKVPVGVWDIKSTIVSNPDIAHAAITPAREQYTI